MSHSDELSGSSASCHKVVAASDDDVVAADQVHHQFSVFDSVTLVARTDSKLEAGRRGSGERIDVLNHSLLH